MDWIFLTLEEMTAINRGEVYAVYEEEPPEDAEVVSEYDELEEILKLLNLKR